MSLPPTDIRTGIRTVAVLGAGLIGASWAALFLSRGLTVRMADPAPVAEADTRARIAAAWPHLAALSSIPDTPDWDAFHFSSSIADACDGAGFVQENTPDRLAVKQAVLAEAEEALTRDTVFASSTSSLMPSEIAQSAQNPGRVIVAHPMNPPHLVPLVELVPGRDTDAATCQTAQRFYTALDRECVLLRRERRGHLANRLTSALYREAVNCVLEGIASVEDVDRAIAHGPGLRWALMGPHLIYHLGGGTGGYRAYLQHLGPTQEARWADLGSPRLDAEAVETLVTGLESALHGKDMAQLEEARDKALVALAMLKQQSTL